MSRSANQRPALLTTDQSEPLMTRTLICLLDPPSQSKTLHGPGMLTTPINKWMPPSMLKHRDNPHDIFHLMMLMQFFQLISYLLTVSDAVSDATLGGNIAIV